MNALNTLNIRTSDIVLGRLLNPSQSGEYKAHRAIDMVEACGLIPDFFAQACLHLEYESEEDHTIQTIADEMDRAYQYGGFSIGIDGEIAADGTFLSDGDDDLAAICRYDYESRFYLYVYPYAITAIVDVATGESKIGRFD